MKRTKNKDTPSAILTADWHLREDTPVCRTDDFQTEQWKKVQEIARMQTAFGCPVFHAGDLFNHWKPSPWLLSKTMQHLPEQFWTVYGNHDLPQHNLELANKCGVYALATARWVNLLTTCHWNHTPDTYSWRFYKDRKMLVWHVMNYQGRKPWPGCTDPSSAKLLRKYPHYDLILTGHNHKPFVEEYEGRLLVNPGSITRQEAKQADHRPRVYLYYAEEHRVESVELNYNEGVISREHISNIEERDNRIDAFISKLDTDWEAEMSFEDNLHKFFSKNKTSNAVQEIITKSLDNDNS